MGGVYNPYDGPNTPENHTLLVVCEFPEAGADGDFAGFMVKPETPEIQTLTSDLVEKFYENIGNKCLSGYAQKDGDFKKFKYRKYNALDNGRVLKMMIWAGKKKPIFLNVEYQMDFTGYLVLLRYQQLGSLRRW